MKRNILPVIMLLLILAGIAGQRTIHTKAIEQTPQDIQAPVLKWEGGGCYSWGCELGWYSSPAVHDIDNDNQPEVIASAYSIIALDGSTGELEWRASSGHDRGETDADNVGRTWPGIVIADVDNDGSPEIVTAHGGGWVSVYNEQGYFEPGWPQRPISNELRGLLVADLDNNDDLEIIVNGALGSKTNTWVYEHDGSLRPGWPQLNNEDGYAWGLFNDNTAAGDLDGDGIGEIIVPSDVHYINAYNPDGSHIVANPMYEGKNWGQVGIWESLEIELRGWGRCNGVRAESYRTNFADGPANIVDVNGDGIMEVVVTGNVYDCDAGYPPSRYTGVYIFNADRSRFNADGFDWNTVPVDTGAPLSEDYNVIESSLANSAVADLDGDGRMEIIFSSYDGRVHAYWLDKSEHGNWPFNVYQPSNGYLSFASEPTVADLDADGHAEVLFTTWVQKSSGQVGKLYILDYLGNQLHAVSLPNPHGSRTWNGAEAAPTLANIDSDPDLEVIINTANSGIVVYELPGTSNAIVYWGTGRGSYQRSGVILQDNLPGNLQGSEFQVSNSTPLSGEIITYTIQLKNSNGVLKNVTLTNSLPDGLDYAGGLTASSGTFQVNGQTITWNGDVSSDTPVTIRYQSQVNESITSAQALTSILIIEDGLGRRLERSLTVIANGQAIHLPLIRH